MEQISGSQFFPSETVGYQSARRSQSQLVTCDYSGLFNGQDLSVRFRNRYAVNFTWNAELSSHLCSQQNLTVLNHILNIFVCTVCVDTVQRVHTAIAYHAAICV